MTRAVQHRTPPLPQQRPEERTDSLPAAASLSPSLGVSNLTFTADVRLRARARGRGRVPRSRRRRQRRGVDGEQDGDFPKVDKRPEWTDGIH